MNIFLFPLSGLTSDLNSHQRIEPTDPRQTMFYHTTAQKVEIYLEWLFSTFSNKYC